MRRRSRKRSGHPGTPEGDDIVGGRPPRAPWRAARRARLDEAPSPPWAPVPLTEICILGGGVLLVVGLFGGPRGLLVGFGLALVFIATIELTLREHLAGYRSHSLLLGGCAAGATLALLALATALPRAVLVAVALIVFAVVVTVMRKVFRKRAGGMSWRA